MAYPTTDPAIRFWTKVQFPEPNDGCWLWTGHCMANGYATFRTGGVHMPLVLVHRWAYEFCVGPIPDGLQIDHLCCARSCVRPDHLEPVTAMENVRRSARFIQRELPTEHSKYSWQHKITRCPQGHTYDRANTYVHQNGYRKCRQCRREKEAVRKARLRVV